MNKVLKIIVLVILALALLMAGCSPTLTKVGNPAPDFQLLTLDGNPVPLSDLQGKPVLINFWQVRCPPCRVEMPYLQQVYEEW